MGSLLLLTAEEKSRYNGKTIEQIKDNLPKGLSRRLKDRYISNCKEVINHQTHGHDLQLIDLIKNENFQIIKPYIIN